jgi:hypothetical protein
MTRHFKDIPLLAAAASLALLLCVSIAVGGRQRTNDPAISPSSDALPAQHFPL